MQNHGDLRRARQCTQTVQSTVVAHCSSKTWCIDRVVINKPDPHRIDVAYRTVVVEVTIGPVTAIVSITRIAIAVIDAAIEADVVCPEAVVEAIVSAPENPKPRRPQRTYIGSLHPRTWHPVVPVRSPGPITRSPDVVRIRRGRLIIVR